jgi:membrane-bound metal-dependent hydrolase YbcI (DUF457 family)
VVAGSAFIGCYSHVWLDGIMHADVALFYSLSDANDWLGLVGISELYLLCLVSGGVGALLFYTVRRAARYRRGNGGSG